MPHRSNQFQAIVAYIAKQIAPSGAVVRESVDVEESGTSIRREVDTLIEIDTGLTRVRVAIECRDRNRRATIQWIDELIGKYALTPVDRVLAVSAAGYSKAAELKARRHNIDILTLRNIVETDWPSKFAKLSIVKVTPYFSVSREVAISTEPDFTGQAGGSDRVQVREPDGKSFTSSLNSFGSAAQSYALACAKTQLNENPLSFLEGRRLDKPLFFSMTLRLDGHGIVLLHDRSEYRITEVIVDLRVDYEEVTKLPAAYQSLADSAVLTSLRTDLFSLIAVQTEGSARPEVFFETPKHRHASTKRVTKKTRRK